MKPATRRPLRRRFDWRPWWQGALALAALAVATAHFGRFDGSSTPGSTSPGSLLEPSLFEPSLAEAGEPGWRSVILVSWDGARLDVLRSLLQWQPASEEPKACPSKMFEPRMPSLCGQHWTCLPTLCRFQLVESRVTDGKPLTRVQHASMLTGYPSEVTGITTNSGAARMPAGITVYERLHSAFGSSIRQAHVGMFKYTVSGILNWPRDAGILADGYVLGRGGPDDYTGVSTNENFLPFIEEFAGQRFFLFQHQKGIDWCGHHISAESIQYRETMMEADARLAELLGTLDRLALRESTLVLVTTDHGFEGNIHLGRRRASVTRTWIAADVDRLECYARANVVDVLPTILDAFGLDPDSYLPDLPGRSLLDWNRTQSCVPPTCGNGSLEPGEECDGTDLSGETCETLELGAGTLACDPTQCSFDVSECPQDVASAKLSVSGAGTGNGQIELSIRDVEGAGPSFDPAVENFSATITRGAEILWSGEVMAGSEGWSLRTSSVVWGSRFEPPESGLVNLKIPTPIRRLKLKMRANHVDLPSLEGAGALTATLRIGGHRYDFSAPCVVTSGGETAACNYVQPVVP